ncbi:MAG: hypothetical protein HQL91_05200 [Magnetococcales bacterium]|nr:hypothetical protein [Magnetococcales bacterium]
MLRPHVAGGGAQTRGRIQAIPMIHLLYSADYELYLGSLAQPEAAVLLAPTAQLLATCEKIGIPLTLFADVACLWRYRELNRHPFPDQAEAQLVAAIRQGHDVQTHLHPHWITTRFDGARFHFDPKDYRIGTISPDPEACGRLARIWLQRATDHLTTLLTPHAPDYRCLAFRAGGYGLQPHEGVLLQALYATGYRIDSSIVPGARFATPVQEVDFTAVPALGNYWLAPATGLATPAPQGTGLFEIPIAACRFSAQERRAVRVPEALRQALALLTNRPTPPVRGLPCTLPATPDDTTDTLAASRLKRAYWRARAILANDFQRLELGTDLRALLACFDRYVRTRQSTQPEEPLFLSMNIHPKGIHPAHLDTLTRFHQTLLQRHPGKIRAITFQQAWQLLNRDPVGMCGQTAPASR